MESFIPQEYPQATQTPSEVPVTSDELYATYMQEERVKNIISQISPDNQLLEIQWRIKGYVKNPATQQWQKIDKDAPDISPLLVSNFISYLSSVLNQNTTMSNFSSPEINKIMKGIIEWTLDDLDINAEAYGIGNNYSERTRIAHILWNNIFAAFKRAQNGMESRRIFSALNVTENLSQDPKKKGILDALKVWK